MMCGITGWIDWVRDLRQEEPTLTKMTATLTPRGPDAGGTWVSTAAALGHRRLIVVDPAGGEQPMVRQRGERECVLVYNGELYNTEELRRELAGRGWTFRGRSDTEVLLLSYLEWGAECVTRFNGIFAFGIWCEQDQRLFLARDRLGVKPLFYAERGSALLFASELKALLANPLVRSELGPDGLAEVWALGPSRTPGHGVFRDVKELRPGCWLQHDRSGTRVGRYWQVESRTHEDDLETTTMRVHDLLADAVERQLVSDVPLCTLLSGGLDSSAISAFAARHYAAQGLGPLDTYSVDYVDNAAYFQANWFQPDADAPWVTRMSEYLETRHHGVLVDTPQLIEALFEAMRARDLPGMVDIDSSLLLFSREIKRGATVGLSGESADEIFGGYPWFHSEKALAATTFPWLRATAERTALLRPELAAWANPAEYVARRYEETLAEVPRLPGETGRAARLREVAYLNLTWFLTTLLDRKDRMSMASGLEVRVPYCDHRLVEYVWNIPWAMKNWGDQRKGILRRALRDVLPEDVLYRKKSPYPKTHHPAYREAMRRRLLEILADPSSPLLQLVDVENVRQLALSAGPEFGLAWYGQLMGGVQLLAYLIQVDAWLKEYRVTLAS